MTDVRVLRVFTRDGTGGNHLGVVEDGAAMDTAAMQSIATDLGYSETVFFTRDLVRIFTPANEMPFAGHPIVGSAWVLGRGEDGATGTMTIQIGDIEWAITDAKAWVTFPQQARVTAEDAARAPSFGLAQPHRAYLVELPLPYIVYEYDDAEMVATAEPDVAAIAATGSSVYLVAPEADGMRVRFFAPSLGVDEDPATGSAATALAGVRVAQGQLSGEHTLHQGQELGQPCSIDLKWGDGLVKLGGHVAEDDPRTV